MLNAHNIKNSMLHTVIFLSTLSMACVEVVHAEEWSPTRNVEIVVPFAAGGGNDIPARIIQNLMRTHRMLKVSSTVVNKPGGGRGNRFDLSQSA